MTPDGLTTDELHNLSDKDVSPLAQHHTLGISPNQALPGNFIKFGVADPNATLTRSNLPGSLYIQMLGGFGVDRLWYYSPSSIWIRLI